MPFMETSMQDDERCCGTGTCIIDAQGRCWCGQQWDGEKMCFAAGESVPSDEEAAEAGKNESGKSKPGARAEVQADPT